MKVTSNKRSSLSYSFGTQKLSLLNSKMQKANSHPAIPNHTQLNSINYNDTIYSSFSKNKIHPRLVSSPVSIKKKNTSLPSTQNNKICDVLHYSILRILNKKKLNNTSEFQSLNLNLKNIFFNQYNVQFDKEVLALSLLYFYRLVHSDNQEFQQLLKISDINKIFLVCLSLSLKFLRDEKVANKFFLIFNIINNSVEFKTLERIILNHLQYHLFWKKNEWFYWCNILNALEMESEKFQNLNNS
ncbi:hypothetical protein HDU92_002233 [Lobulomyces angularis]|nr:hypothetical protein HDU92_002233 [Lobulomyces angularis]